MRLDGLAERYPAQLSGGQRQRMALARALAPAPEVLLLDEPFGALDAQVRGELREWLRRLHDEIHVTTIFVTHDQEEAMDVAEQIVLVNHGRIEQVGTARELYEHPTNEFVMSFIGPVNRIGDLAALRETCRSPLAPGRATRLVLLTRPSTCLDTTTDRSRTDRRPLAAKFATLFGRSPTKRWAGIGSSSARVPAARFEQFTRPGRPAARDAGQHDVETDCHPGTVLGRLACGVAPLTGAESVARIPRE